MQQYDIYKKSGVDWIGEIPEHWEIRKFKRLFKEKRKITDSSLNSGAISFGEVVYKDDEKITEATKLSYQVLNVGEFLINPLNMNYDLKSLRIGLSKINVVVSSGYIILNSKNGLDKNYYRWLLRIYDIVFMKTLGAGVRQTINYNDLADTFLILPPVAEQQAMACFLDDKIVKIEQTIAIKQKEIELLKERRQILIQKAVTKGLDDTVKLKDSGVDWIGEIPEHWEVRKLKYVVYMQSGETITAESFTDEGYSVMGGNGFRGYTNRYTNDGNFILIGRQGALCGNVNYAQGKFFATEHAIVVYPNKDVLDILWLGEVIKLADLNNLSQTAAQPGISVTQIKNVIIPFIPQSEQLQIVEYLKKIEEKIAKVILLKQQEIEKLKEYKTVLVDQVVTGKVRVS